MSASDTLAIVRARLGAGRAIADSDILALCDEAERLRNEVERLKKALVWCSVNTARQP